jgi:hypothetical protein
MATYAQLLKMGAVRVSLPLCAARQIGPPTAAQEKTNPLLYLTPVSR